MARFLSLLMGCLGMHRQNASKRLWRAEQNAAVETERIVNDAALNLTIAKG